MSPLLRNLAVVWGLLGVLALLGRALVSLSPLAYEAIVGGMAWWQWAIAGAWVGFMAYTEGYRGFQQRFSPMVAARLLVLREHTTVLRLVLAPMFAMGLIQATRRRLLVSWGVLIAVVCLILVVRLLEQPWRGIVDMGVVVGLAWGTVSLLVHTALALSRGTSSADAELATTDGDEAEAAVAEPGG